MTVELLRVSGLLGAISALYFTVNAAIDEEYQKKFAEDIPTEVTVVLAVRAVYLTLLERLEAQ